jgi:DNA-binding winged helix-turn-helix (wHTH) protein
LDWGRIRRYFLGAFCIDAMAEPSSTSLGVVRFGVFELDLQSGELRKAGILVGLQEQSVKVLMELLERPGELVTREQLRQRLWPGGTFVDFEHGLNAVINRLREALGDSAESPRFIQTVPRRGYRFIAPVDKGLQEGSAAHPRPTWWHFGSLMWPAVVIALAIGAALYLFKLRPWSGAPMRASPLTSLPGLERYPTFSPDGNQIAFTWDGGNGDNQDIYVKVVGAGVPLRLTTHPAVDQKPVWSSDGRHIAFIRSSEEGSGILVIPALGGPERKIVSFISEHEWAAGPSWSPDGRTLAVSEIQAQGPLSIVLVSMDSLEKRKLTSPPVGSVGDCAPVISPDGRTVAFNRVSAAGGYLPRPDCRRRAYAFDLRAGAVL